MAAPRQPGTNGAYAIQSPAVHMPLPMTPQSAALGPAVQATVPSTPQSATFNGMFSGNVFERADAFLQTNGSSVGSSRAGTMTSTYTNDGTVTPASILSPMNSMIYPRYNTGKVTFWNEVSYFLCFFAPEILVFSFMSELSLASRLWNKWCISFPGMNKESLALEARCIAFGAWDTVLLSCMDYQKQMTMIRVCRAQP